MQGEFYEVLGRGKKVVVQKVIHQIPTAEEKKC